MSKLTIDECKRIIMQGKKHLTAAEQRIAELEANNGSRWFEMFGTPERAAETLVAMDIDAYNWCNDDSSNHRACKECPYEYDYYGCYLPDGFSLLEWLSGDAE